MRKLYMRNLLLRRQFYQAAERMAASARIESVPDDTDPAVINSDERAGMGYDYRHRD
jgi:hypothetical protein